MIQFKCDGKEGRKRMMELRVTLAKLLINVKRREFGEQNSS